MVVEYCLKKIKKLKRMIFKKRESNKGSRVFDLALCGVTCLKSPNNKNLRKFLLTVCLSCSELEYLILPKYLMFFAFNLFK